MASGLDERFQAATPLRRALNKVFPDHWSFMLGELALYSFVMLLLTGTVLALFFDPSMRDVTYDGSYAPMRGLPMSAAYDSALRISFDIRGGLFMRQIHHWAADLFMAAIVVHMARIFLTGAFRKPREANWVIGILMFWLGFVEGFAGYSLPDDGLSGTGLRIAASIVQAVPVIGTWLETSLFGGEFPGDQIIGRLYITHVLLVPAALVALISVHLALVVKQKHTQWPRAGRTNDNVAGERLVPGFAGRSAGLAMIVFAVLTALGGLVQINPLWLFGPYEASVVSAASQPDWYVMFLDGALRLMPPWEIRAFGYTLSPVFWPGVVLPGLMTILALAYPLASSWRHRGQGWQNLLQRPRDAPTRTAVAAMAGTFYLVLTVSAANDLIADKFHISLNAMIWAGRIGAVLLPPLAFYLTRRLCLGTQQQDRTRLAHGVETGLLIRTAEGEYREIAQPLAPPEQLPLPYAGWAVPKRMKRVGALPPPRPGFLRPLSGTRAAKQQHEVADD
ncbi:ubiquinol-cytochrome c reductase cytochrome b subunit [Dactylosporangium matsuzakiense]|uniref:Cytochrome bc1 complex cytochrome b subunit n=1 Tax=Dactylosporangium matsuzakiense TaxID=53360 RepID=A0A9W6KGM5_9ACTN|nr:ubiquinol-cytochrome c reductase cytochrome b subunit [Dactylosporangium matsuzakiense]